MIKLTKSEIANVGQADDWSCTAFLPSTQKILLQSLYFARAVSHLLVERYPEISHADVSSQICDEDVTVKGFPDIEPSLCVFLEIYLHNNSEYKFSVELATTSLDAIIQGTKSEDKPHHMYVMTDLDIKEWDDLIPEYEQLLLKYGVIIRTAAKKVKEDVEAGILQIYEKNLDVQRAIEESIYGSLEKDILETIH